MHKTNLAGLQTWLLHANCWCCIVLMDICQPRLTGAAIDDAITQAPAQQKCVAGLACVRFQKAVLCADGPAAASSAGFVGSLTGLHRESDNRSASHAWMSPGVSSAMTRRGPCHRRAAHDARS